VSVGAVVVLWGGGVKDWLEVDLIRQIDDVTVVAGPGLQTWTTRLDAGGPDQDQVAEVWPLWTHRWP